LAQLQYKRRNLPEHAELATLRSARTAAAADLVGADTVVTDLEVDQARAEADLQPVRDRLARNQRRIADGTIPDPKALGSMVDEVEHLKRRIGDLEDAELEIMEQLEAATNRREQLRDKIAELDGKLEEATQRRDRAVAEIDEAVAERRAERTELAPQIPTDLLALYDKIAAARGGVGAAELNRRRCTGCQLELNVAELRVFASAAEDEVLRCEECSRILVRTQVSGL
jgi:predicted  nucleic acid-binding Zn-ribbon protein